MRRKKYSLKTRMLFMMTSLILAVFLLILAVFNLLISNYIETNATSVLTESRRERLPPDRLTSEPQEKERKIPQTPAGSAERLFVTKSYEVLLPDYYPEPDENSPLFDFIQTVEAGKIDLESNEILKVETEEGLYYYTAVNNRAIEEGYEVYFINMTNLYSFEKNLSTMLLLIMSFALLLTVGVTYIISKSIAGPVKVLSEFAKRIGDGEYGILQEDFRDEEVHELKNAMNESSEKLKKYDEEQRVFFQNASHELRTPLQVIKTNAEALEYGLITREKAVPVIKQEVDNLGELVEDIIVLSRLDARSRDIIYERMDLRETLSYTLERFSAILMEKNLKVNYDFQDEPVWFTYEEKSMERAFQNLIANAVRYALTTITVGCRASEGRIIIKISNDGQGIHEEDIPRIFDRFYKGEKGNHGIGLSIVKSIISSYEGRIEVSTSNHGTSFTLFLPSRRNEAQQDQIKK